MVNPFILTKLDDTTGNSITYTADNITNVVVDFTTPVAPMPLPQMEDFHNILIKVEGNTTTSNISWKIRDITGTAPFSDDNSILTAMEQIEHFKSNFVPVTVSDSYTLTIGDSLVMKGIIIKMSFTLSGTSPVVWDGSLQFIHGNVASSTDALLADAPVKITQQQLTADGLGSKEVSIPQIKTEYFGADTGITGYIVKYKLSSADSWTVVSTSDLEYSTTQTNTTNQTLTVEMSSTGTYDFKVAALTATNTEGNKWSDPIENVVVT